jgi:hypothetical protein
MDFLFASGRSPTVKAAIACAALMAGAAQAQTPVTLSASYAVIMTHVHVGDLTWAVDFSDQAYAAKAHGQASGVFSVLFSGEGSIATRGVIVQGRLAPQNVDTEVTDDDGHDEVQMTFADGVLERVTRHGPPPKGERVKVTPDLLHDIADPLSALLIPSGGDAFAHANCDRTLRIFDGQRRYNLALSFKRIDKMKLAHGYAGPVLVCGVMLSALAGYRTDSLLVHYLAGKDDLGLWFAPVAGVGVMAPIRALMPTLIGTLELRASEFTVRKHPPPPAQRLH